MSETLFGRCLTEWSRFNTEINSTHYSDAPPSRARDRHGGTAHLAPTLERLFSGESARRGPSAPGVSELC
jgi:hypothetical protein